MRFFGTYEFSWIESQRALAAFSEPDDERRAKSSAEVGRSALLPG